MPVTEKKYPEWVQQYRERGTTIKKRGDSYYLYKRTSRRVPGKKYPQPVDTFIGVITRDGVVASEKKKVSLTDIEVYEYGFSRALWELCPEGWKKPLGDDWEDVFRVILQTWSPNSYLLRSREHIPTERYHYNFPAQMASLSRRIYKERGINLAELECPKQVYFLVIDKQEAISRINEQQKALAEKAGISLELE